MIAYRILGGILIALSLVVIPVQTVTTFLLGLLVALTFGLLLFAFVPLWLVLLAPMLGASWLCGRFEPVRAVVGLLGIPWAVVAHVYVCLIPSMGEFESRASKLLLVETWPYTWEYWEFAARRVTLESLKDHPLPAVLARVSAGDPIRQRTIGRIAAGEELDPNV